MNGTSNWTADTSMKHLGILAHSAEGAALYRAGPTWRGGLIKG
jgi:hypothetical protein